MRLLVCGGRDYDDGVTIFGVLDHLHAQLPAALIIHGAARGADTWAKSWARTRGVPHLPFPADWDQEGRAAGVLRNQRMLEEGKPDQVLAFPGGVGTADMVRRARAAGVPVVEALPRPPARVIDQ